MLLLPIIHNTYTTKRVCQFLHNVHFPSSPENKLVIMTVICLADMARLKKTDHIITLDSIKGCSIDPSVKSG